MTDSNIWTDRPTPTSGQQQYRNLLLNSKRVHQTLSRDSPILIPTPTYESRISFGCLYRAGFQCSQLPLRGEHECPLQAIYGLRAQGPVFNNNADSPLRPQRHYTVEVTKLVSRKLEIGVRLNNRFNLVNTRLIFNT